MLPPQSILNVWRKFDGFPMERLTKLWFYHQCNSKKQRDVSLMREHRSQYGISGNCFDLAIWLLDELHKEKISAYPIGYDLFTEDAYVAVIALDDSGSRYLCDLGDQWINPILVNTESEDYTDETLDGFFPGANVQILPNRSDLEILYYRPNGKVSKQKYNPDPINIDHFLQAAEYSQNLITPKPLLECRIPYKNEIAHWEFYNWKSFLSTREGLFHEPKLNSVEEWAHKINEVTGYDMGFLFSVLEQYKKITAE